MHSVGDWRLSKLFWRTMGYFCKMAERANEFAYKMTHAAKMVRGGVEDVLECFVFEPIFPVS